MSRQSPKFPPRSLAKLFLAEPHLLEDRSWWYPESKEAVGEVIKGSSEGSWYVNFKKGVS